MFFLCIFGLDGAKSTSFLKKITNQIFQLNHAQLICEPVQSEKQQIAWVQCHGTSRFIPNFVFFFRPFYNKPLRKQIRFSANFISYQTVTQTKTYTCQVSTLPKLISDKTASKKALISLQNRFFGRRISFCHTFSHSDLECLPPGDPRTLCV